MTTAGGSAVWRRSDRTRPPGFGNRVRNRSALPAAARFRRDPADPPPFVSVVVPTFREADNIEMLVNEVKAVAALHRLDIELIVVDDASDDGTAEKVTALGQPQWIRLIRRTGKRSLSLSVLDGLRTAKGRILVVMDADLSHPPTAIPRLVGAIRDGGSDFVIGSRYVDGSTIDARWSRLRRLCSLTARVLARPLVSAADSTSGFFALDRERFEAAAALDPVGYKIGLELMVKCHCRSISEIPIRFSDRLRGTTKLGWRQQVEYLEHLRRLATYRWKTKSRWPGLPRWRRGSEEIMTNRAGQAVPLS